MRYDGKKVLVVGLGSSGQAAVRFFAKRGAEVSVTDRNSPETLAPVLDLLDAAVGRRYLGSHPREVFLDQDIIVPSPGVPWNMPELETARANGVRVAGELEFAVGELLGRVIGVTGSNGKTTTVSLIGHILETAGIKTVVGGNIGRPLLDMAEESSEDQWSVLELSSFQLEAMETFRCNIVAILNITPDHLDRHGDFDSYVAAKARILAPQTAEDVAVLNREDPVVASLASQCQGKTVWFQRSGRAEDGASSDGESIWFEGRMVGSAQLPIPGAHNLENAVAAAAVAAIAGAPDNAIADGLASFKAVEHRLERVATLGGVDYFNDSKATNVDATRKAIESFGSDVLEGRVQRILLIGEAAQQIERQLDGQSLVQCGNLARALDYAAESARPGDTVLLSPACASFDQFDNFGHRGREFKRLVGELAMREGRDDA
jgi:UDP-N-acetylmuramoylalanine--D-glutamate ligase